MITAQVPLRGGGYDTVPTYTLEDFPYDQLPTKAMLTKNKKKKPEAYCSTYGMFDIETTTIRCDRPYGYMYHWQICLGGYVCTGRRWEEFFRFLEKVQQFLRYHDSRRLVIYVFNLGYEFSFLYPFLVQYCGGYKMFAAQSHQPLRVECANGVEWRCAYKLTNMTLQKAVENEKGVKHLKAAGDLDYRQQRTADTILTAEEFGYCVADVVSGYELIQRRLINEHDNLETIPMTSTGYVRRDCRRACRKYPKYREKYFSPQTLTKDAYILLKEAGRGGNTHANRVMSGRIWHDADSYDEVSAYPAMILLRDFPCTRLVPYGDIESREELQNLLDTRACLFRVTFEGLTVRPDVTMPYISESKCRDVPPSVRLDNGRILRIAEDDIISMTLTDIDYRIICKQYTWQRMMVYDMHIADYGPLPEPIRQTVMSYFRRKCLLKEEIRRLSHIETPDAEQEKALEDAKYLYGKTKNLLNGIFGMMYQDPVHDVLTMDPVGLWESKEPDLQEALDKYNNSRNSFLCYSWGVWVTAHARAHLERLLDLTGPGTIYCDTDSSKCVGADHAAIEEENACIRQQCEERGAYCDIEGTRYYLGEYEKENAEPLTEFITLGAKKYAYTDRKGLHVTVSGVNKKLGAKELGDIANFRPGFIFNEAGGLTLWYNHDEIHEITVDGCTMTTAANVGMTESSYRLGITGEYAELIGYNVLENK